MPYLVNKIPSLPNNILIGFRGERQQSDLAGAFHRVSNRALVFGTCTGLTARANLSFFGDIAAKKISILIVNFHIFI